MKAAVRVLLVSVCLWVLSSAFPAFSQEAYKFVDMWPRLEQPWYFGVAVSVAADLSGNVYILESGGPSSESWSRVQKFSQDGNFITKWGSNGTGDGQFNDPSGVATDATGNIYVVDTDNKRIQKFDANGNFITKWGSHGSGDGQFYFPVGIAVDSSGHVYVTDYDNERIQKFDSNGNFITKWGSQGTGDGQFQWPHGIAVDSSGHVFIADNGNCRIQKFDSNGVFIAKWGSRGSGDGQLARPSGVAVDSLGNVYVADTINYRVQKFDPYGRFITKWGSYDYGSDGQFRMPYGVAADPFGYVYVVDLSNRIQKFDSNGRFITRWAPYGSGDGHFNVPRRVAVTPAGDVYVVDSENHRIQKFDSSGNFITKWGSQGTGDGQFWGPHGVAVDSSGHVYVIDIIIKKFDSDGRFISAWAPNVPSPPRDVAVTLSGYLYFSTYTDLGIGRFIDVNIWKFDSDGNFITKWGSYGSGDGEFCLPVGVAVDITEQVYVADDYNSRIQKFDANGNFITKWGSHGTGDGQFDHPTGVAVDTSGNVFVVDTDNNRIQKFDSNGNFLTKLGSMGSEDGQFLHPEGIAVDSLGNIYVADTGNHRIQKFSPVGQETISTPTAPSGPVSGIVGPEYIFSTGGASSDLGHAVEYRFSWGDGTHSDWSSSPTASQSWSLPGAYSVKAQARCSIDTSIGSNWSAGVTVNIASTIILESPAMGHHFSTCSLYSLPTFSWSASEPFNGYQVQFSPSASFATVAVNVPVSVPGITMPLDTWKDIMLIPGPSGGTVYWRVVGTRANGSSQMSEVRSFVIDAPLPAGNPTIAPTVRRPKPILTWRTNCNTKFKVVFGSDSSFTKKTYSIEIANPAGGDFTAFKTLSSLQWMKIKLLVKNKKGSTIYWCIESWDELGRQAKTNVMSFVLKD
jgi:tripartite motif-containing protein 71